MKWVHIQLSSGFIWFTRVMERAKAHFQMKTNLQDAWCEDGHYIHNKVMQRGKNRNKTGYLRHCPTHTHVSDYLVHTETHINDDNMIWSLIVSVSCEFYTSAVRLLSERGRLSWRMLPFCIKISDVHTFDAVTACTVWAEEAATWSTPTVTFRRTTSGGRRATKHVGWAWS